MSVTFREENISINKMKRSAAEMEKIPVKPSQGFVREPENKRYPKNISHPQKDTSEYNTMADQVMTEHGLDPENFLMVRGPIRDFLKSQGQGDYENSDLDALIKTARESQNADKAAEEKEAKIAGGRKQKQQRL